MAKLMVKIPPKPATAYPILIQPGLLQQPDSWLSKKIDIADVVIITDHTVKTLYGNAFARLLKQKGRRVLLLAFKPGERSKNHCTKQYLEEQMLRNGYGRQTLCIALGGGVVGDIAGFIAATYMRGIPVIQIPTSLLAMIDSSVGGKTAIDTEYGKNLIGAFWQPAAVVMDIHSLRTLPKKHRINGLIEAIKIAITCDQGTFQFIQKNLSACLSGDEKILQNVIQRAVKLKAAVVAQDETERSGLRSILNFGHTIGHALEKVCDYKVLHGYAIGYGILVEAKIAELNGILSTDNYKKIAEIFSNLGIFPKDLKKYSVNEIIKATQLDKKVKSGKAHYVLVKKIGKVYMDKKNYTHIVEDQTIENAFQQIMETAYARK